MLKHYEDVGLLTPDRTESGYRYYPFNTAALLIECIRLRNYGMTLREIREILTQHSFSTEQVERRLDENMERLRNEAQLNTLLTEDYARFQQWKEPLTQADFDWDIRWSHPMCFLPHTDKDSFLEDARIYELLRDWMSNIPIVKSSMKVEARGKMTWGFLVEQRDLERLHLPVNDVVEYIPPRKIFYYKFRSSLAKMTDEDPVSAEHPAFRLIRSMNLEGDDTYFRTVLIPAEWDEGILARYGYYAIPLRRAGEAPAKITE